MLTEYMETHFEQEGITREGHSTPASLDPVMDFFVERLKAGAAGTTAREGPSPAAD